MILILEIIKQKPVLSQYFKGKSWLSGFVENNATKWVVEFVQK